MERIRSVVSYVSSLYVGTPLQKMLYEATDYDVVPTPDLMAKIAEASFESYSASVIYRHIWLALDSESKNAAKIVKALSLVEYLVKFGSFEVVDMLIENIYRIRQLVRYGENEFVDEFTEIIRNKAVGLNDVLSNPSLIQHQRYSAARTHERCAGRIN